jgi:hypothetical protein
MRNEVPLPHQHENQLKMDQNLNVKPEIMMSLQENRGNTV